MRKLILLFLSLLCLGSAAMLTAQAQTGYQAMLSVLPSGSTIAGIPVGGISAHEAGVRLVRAYLLTPVEAHYAGSVIHLDPQKSGFQLHLDEMLAEATQPAPLPFWDYLLDRRPSAVTVPLKADLNRAQLKAYIETEIAPRYERLPTGAYLLPETLELKPGQQGESLKVDEAVESVGAALFSLESREVEFSSRPIPALPPYFEQLDLMLSTFLQTSGFGGTIEVYLQDLQTGQEINLAYHNGQPVTPGIAFTAASTIKIPVMVSAFRSLAGNLSENVKQQMVLMIDLSDNGSTDEVMRAAIDENLAPLQVTRDMEKLGLENTFLAGMFYPGAPLLERIETPANRRTDISTDPDPYNQTTAADMGRLLAAIELCADQEEGLLVETFVDDITREECQFMIEMLRNNRKAVLLEAGLPEGTVLAHKYGWVTDPLDGLMHNVSDAAVVYLPGGNFALAVYVYQQDQLLWDSAQALVARLAIVASRYYTFASQQSGINP